MIACKLLAVSLTAFLSVQAAESTNPTPDPQLSPGRDLFEQGDLKKAAEFFDTAVRQHPGNVEALIYRGRIAFEENRLEEASRWFAKATEVAPRNSAAFLWLGRAAGMQAKAVGAPMGIGNARKARKSLERAVELDPKNTPARLDLITYYRQAPGIVGGSMRAAQAHTAELTKQDPYLGTVVKGELAFQEKDYESAERSYRAALELDPKRTEAYVRLGALALRNKQYDQAFAAFEKILELDPNEKQAYFHVGRTSDVSGQRLEQGEAALKKYLQCRPNYIMPKLTWAHRRLGNIYLKRGKRDLARREYLAALALDPNDKEASAALRAVE